MTDKLRETAAFLREHDCFDILTHDYPDGDTLGSGFALCLALQQMGKKARDFETQTVVTVDVAEVRLLGKNRAAYEGRIDLCIDHHMTNVVDAPLRLVDGHAAANCAILYKLFREMGITWTRAIANCLYTGISTDTGCFRYTNTTAETLRIGADIIDIGCDTAYINKVMFETKTKKKLALEREVYDTIEYCFDDRCAIIAVTCDMQRSIGVSDGELEGLASIPRQIEGVEIGITLREKAPGEFKVSVRTNGQVSASALCATLGGGGHSAAAGCTVKGTLDEAKAQLKAAAAKFL